MHKNGHRPTSESREVPCGREIAPRCILHGQFSSVLFKFTYRACRLSLAYYLAVGMFQGAKVGIPWLSQHDAMSTCPALLVFSPSANE
jgi:hypothetical protein